MEQTHAFVSSPEIIPYNAMSHQDLFIPVLAIANLKVTKVRHSFPVGIIDTLNKHNII